MLFKLFRRPKTLILSLVWPSSTPDSVLWFLAMLQPQLRMEEIFHIQAAELVFDRVSMLFGGFFEAFFTAFSWFFERFWSRGHGGL